MLTAVNQYASPFRSGRINFDIDAQSVREIQEDPVALSEGGVTGQMFLA
jgi:hypothetical protein